ncbi:MAG: ABC transporter ATP-binding protein [Pseudomonadota bacterium]
MALLSVQNLKTHFFTSDGIVKAVDGVSFSLYRGDTLGIVGESGCGKTMLALSLLRLIPDPPGKIVDGKIFYQFKDGKEPADLLTFSSKRIREVRGKNMAMIFQEPMTSLNPVLTIGNQIEEAIKLHLGGNKKELKARTIEILRLVGISAPETRLNDYPHQFSGGMRQRVMIAMALSCHPEILIADEPTTALDVTIQAQILDLIAGLQEKLGMAMILVTHDFGVVAEVTKQVAVMYAGKIVEQGSTKDVFENPRHPYTKGLLNSIISLRKGELKEKLKTSPGTVPDLAHLPIGCSFQNRCPRVQDMCRLEEPKLEEKEPGKAVRCFFPE